MCLCLYIYARTDKFIYAPTRAQTYLVSVCICMRLKVLHVNIIYERNSGKNLYNFHYQSDPLYSFENISHNLNCSNGYFTNISSSYILQHLNRGFIMEFLFHRCVWLITFLISTYLLKQERITHFTSCFTAFSWVDSIYGKIFIFTQSMKRNDMLLSTWARRRQFIAEVPFMGKKIFPRNRTLHSLTNVCRHVFFHWILDDSTWNNSTIADIEASLYPQTYLSFVAIYSYFNNKAFPVSEEEVMSLQLRLGEYVFDKENIRLIEIASTHHAI